jgi:hypothetical protein
MRNEEEVFFLFFLISHGYQTIIQPGSLFFVTLDPAVTFIRHILNNFLSTLSRVWVCKLQVNVIIIGSSPVATHWSVRVIAKSNTPPLKATGTLKRVVMFDTGSSILLPQADRPSFVCDPFMSHAARSMLVVNNDSLASDGHEHARKWHFLGTLV